MYERKKYLPCPSIDFCGTRLVIVQHNNYCCSICIIFIVNSYTFTYEGTIIHQTTKALAIRLNIQSHTYYLNALSCVIEQLPTIIYYFIT